jgi:DNA-binding response OmpR family regulator
VTVLVVEDEPRLARTLVKGLNEEGFAAETVASVAATITRVAAGGLRALVLDLGLPDGDAQTVIPDLRRQSQIPILVLTARDAVEERVRALDNGADDYLVKPFVFAELLARLRALLRRAEPRPTPVTVVADLELLADGVKVAGRAVLLSPRRDLAEAFGYDFDPGTNIVEVHIGHVRRKLAGSRVRIETVRGYGYRLREGT